MLPVLQIGPLALQTPGLALLLGLWLGLTLAEKNAYRRGIHPDVLYNLVFLALIAAAIGARLLYVLRYPGAFIASPVSLISLNPGLLDPLGAAVAGGLAALAFIQRKKLPGWPLLDALTPLLSVVMLALGFSHLASGVAFGAPTNLPWAIDLWGASRHPSQVYEILAAALILAWVWPSRSRWQNATPGVVFLIFLAGSAAARLFLEAWRGDSLILFAGLRSAQIAAWLALAGSLWALHKLRLHPTAVENHLTAQ
jgi:prolipoprotein diacylglyceryltransferase